jgi:hypothetical protein
MFEGPFINFVSAAAPLNSSPVSIIVTELN